MNNNFIALYSGLFVAMLPLVCYRLYENYGISGGINEVFEGLLLHLILFLPIFVIFVVIIKMLKKVGVNISNKILFLVSLLTATSFLYLF